MFLSKLTPDLYHRAFRLDLTNPYDLHRTLLRAFPATADGGPGRVLFRVELPRESRPVVLVQSEKEPNWHALPPGYLTEFQTKPLTGLAIQTGQRLLFRLRANPTKRVGKSATDPRWTGKRVGLFRQEEQERWLVRKGQEGGFRVEPSGVRVIPEGTVTAWKADKRLAFQGVRFEGVLEVTDADRFLKTVTDGVGSAKGLGFGLLSVGVMPGGDE